MINKNVPSIWKYVIKGFLFYLVLLKLTISEMCHKSLQLFMMLWILNNSFNLSIKVLCDFMMRSFTNSELIIPVFYTSMVITDDKITFSLFVYIMSPTERPNKVRITSSMYPTSNHFNILFGTRIFQLHVCNDSS